MSATWTAVLVVGAATMAMKAVGPVLLGGRRLPPAAAGVLAALAPAVLAALVVTTGLADERRLVVDERVAGLLAAAGAIGLRAPVLVVVALAAGVTALVRALGLS